MIVFALSSVCTRSTEPVDHLCDQTSDSRLFFAYAVPAKTSAIALREPSLCSA
jgi:hypothetical protein